MTRSTSYVSFVLIVSIVYSSVILCSVRARTTGGVYNKQHPHQEHPQQQQQQQQGDDPMSHFTEFLRALYAPALNKDNDDSNDIPVMAPAEEQQHQGGAGGVILPILQKRATTRYCGSFLADALQLVCSSGYMSYFPKRSAAQKLIFKENRPEAETEGGVQADSWPFISADKAHQMLSNQNTQFHRVARGVHDECCIKGCSYRELTSYCSPGF